MPSLNAYKKETARARLRPETVLTALEYTHMHVPAHAWTAIPQPLLKEICYHANVPARLLLDANKSMDVNATIAHSSTFTQTRKKIYAVLARIPARKNQESYEERIGKLNAATLKSIRTLFYKHAALGEEHEELFRKHHASLLRSLRIPPNTILGLQKSLETSGTVNEFNPESAYGKLGYQLYRAKLKGTLKPKVREWIKRHSE